MATAKLRPSKNNARVHSKKQIDQIVSSIRRFGWTYPIVVDELGHILCGVGRWLAAQKMELLKVPVMVLSHLNDIEKRTLRIADNKLAANSAWDRKILATELAKLDLELPTLNLSLEITGFEASEVDSLLNLHIDPEQDPVDAAPKLQKDPISQNGDIWGLHDHAIACGNACSEMALRRLMGRHHAAMVFADPPYNVRIAAIVGRGKIKHREFLEASGEKPPEKFRAFLKKFMRLAVKFSSEGSVHFICMDWRHLLEILHAGQDVYETLLNLVVWTKTNAGQGSFYRSQHELIFVFKKGVASHQNNIQLGKHGRNRSNVWSYAGVNTFRAGRLDDLAVHPTVKPIAMVADAMRDCTRRGDIVLDPFMGSGTTILAAERIGRRAFGLEIDPLYVDVAIRRWQQFTGRDAILKSTGQTFDEVTAIRTASRPRRTP
jgi:DNA modification methylase